MREEKQITLIKDIDSVLDFLNYSIREQHIRKKLFEIIDSDPNKDNIIALKVPYIQEKYLVLLKYSNDNQKGLLLIGAERWDIITSVLSGMKNHLNDSERIIFDKLFYELILQINKIEKK